MSLSVYTIILNWNNLEDTSETIVSLKKQDYINHKLILVDNNSSKSIQEELKKRFPQLIYINNDKNLGYTGGNNVGIRYAMEQGADIIIIANNDIVIEDNRLISKAVTIFNNYRKISILGPALHYYNQKDRVQESGTTFFYAKRDHVLLNDYILKERIITDSLKLFDGVPGAFLMARNVVFESIGLFDEKIFMYGDETDLCYRAWINNHYCAIDSSLIVYHKASVNKFNINPHTTYYLSRNSLYFLHKHKKTIKHYSYFIKRYYRDYSALFYRNILSFWKSYPILISIIRGVSDGLLNRMGQRF